MPPNVTFSPGGFFRLAHCQFGEEANVIDDAQGTIPEEDLTGSNPAEVKDVFV